MAQITTSHTRLTNDVSGHTTALFVLLVYVAVMPKELMYLACVFIGATGYLFFLLLQPSTVLSTKDSQASEIPMKVGVTDPKSSESALQHGAANTEMSKKPSPVAPVNDLLAPVVEPTSANMPNTKKKKKKSVAKTSKAERVDDEQKTAMAKNSDANTINNESFKVSGNENHPVEENPFVQANSPSVTSSDTERDSSMKRADAVRCPRFQHKNTESPSSFIHSNVDATVETSTNHLHEKDNLKSSDQSHNETKAANKQEMQNQFDFIMANKNNFVALNQSVNEACNAYGAAARTKLSVGAAPFVLRNKLSADACPYVSSTVCWEWTNKGYCPRGPMCKWEHPGLNMFDGGEMSQKFLLRPEMVQEMEQDIVQPQQSYETMLLEGYATAQPWSFGDPFDSTFQTAPEYYQTFVVDPNALVVMDPQYNDNDDDIHTDDGF